MGRAGVTSLAFLSSHLPVNPILPIAFAVMAAVECGKGGAPSAVVRAGSAATDGTAQAAAMVDKGAGDAAGIDPIESDLWERAKEGDAEDLMRLVDRIGCDAIEERAHDKELRKTAIRAMAYCGDFTELPWLADVAAGAGDDDAIAALESIVDEAARPRRATDPEDAEELHEGCQKLLALARAADKPKARRVAAVRALRMLAERGCMKREEIPSDLDAK
jgi:hypothetical protein